MPFQIHLLYCNNVELFYFVGGKCLWLGEKKLISWVNVLVRKTVLGSTNSRILSYMYHEKCRYYGTCIVTTLSIMMLLWQPLHNEESPNILFACPGFLLKKMLISLIFLFIWFPNLDCTSNFKTVNNRDCGWSSEKNQILKVSV